jgi:hypothetical protein
MTKTIRLLAIAACMVMGLTANAKKMPVPKMYMFGMAASFTDTIVHFTSIQQIDSAWIDTKNDFLLSRNEYSYQLRDYLAQKQEMPQRTCIVVYGKNLKKLEKKYAKIKRLYTAPKKGARKFDVRFLEDADFHFRTIDETPYLEEEEGGVSDGTSVKQEKKKKRGK